MVSTRQMTIGNSGNGGYTNFNHSHNSEPSTSRYNPRNSANIIGTVQFNHNRALQSVQSIHLLDFPQEIIEKIFSYLSFKNICQLRLVNRSVDRICGQILNSTFQRLQNQMLQRFQDIKKKMPRRESARRSHYLAGESDIIETLHMRLTLLQMTFGKHIERKHCCFFPGEILDEVYNILHYIEVTPKLDLPYKVTDELFDLSTMAMEYFKEKIEPNLPEIAYFSTDFLKFSGTFSSKSYALDTTNLVSESPKDGDIGHDDTLDSEDLVETIPQSNMVLRKRIRKIKQGMKRYNSQLSILRQELRTCKRKTTEQQKQINEQQKLLTDQQKQTLEYATRLDDYDKKNEDLSRKFSTLLQELNKCKTELQYWRCKSPAVQVKCTNCGQTSSEELEALMNSGNEQMSDFETLLAADNNVQIDDIERMEEEEKEEEDVLEASSSSVSVVQPQLDEQQQIKSPSTKNIKRKTDEELVSNKKVKRYSRIRNKRTRV